MARVGESKSILDSFMDRYAQGAQQEVNFATTIANARIAFAANERANAYLNSRMMDMNAARPLESANREREMGFLRDYAPGLDKAKFDLATVNGTNLLQSARLKEALLKGDTSTAEAITGKKWRRGPDGLMYSSSDGGENWYVNGSSESDLAASRRITSQELSMTEAYLKRRADLEAKAGAAAGTPAGSATSNPAIVPAPMTLEELSTLQREARTGQPLQGFTLAPSTAQSVAPIDSLTPSYTPTTRQDFGYTPPAPERPAPRAGRTSLMDDLTGAIDYFKQSPEEAQRQSLYQDINRLQGELSRASSPEEKQRIREELAAMRQQFDQLRATR